MSRAVGFGKGFADVTPVLDIVHIVVDGWCLSREKFRDTICRGPGHEVMFIFVRLTFKTSSF